MYLWFIKKGISPVTEKKKKRPLKQIRDSGRLKVEA